MESPTIKSGFPSFKLVFMKQNIGGCSGCFVCKLTGQKADIRLNFKHSAIHSQSR
jgi:hypothetical protein